MNGANHSLDYILPSWPIYVAFAIGAIDGVRKGFFTAMVMAVLLVVIWLSERFWPPMADANLALPTVLFAGLFGVFGYVAGRLASWLFGMWVRK
jgi:hypothetical protein